MKPVNDKENTDHTASLDTFFYRNQTATLNNCEKEPIHLIGSVYAESVIVVIDPSTKQIEAYSNNLSDLLEISLPDNNAVTLETIDPALAQELSDDPTAFYPGHHFPLMTVVETSKQAFQIVYHEHQGLGYLEFIPDAALSPQQYRQKLRLLRNYCTQIIEAETFEAALQLAAEVGKEITEFSRVMIYEFQPDWSGKVVAESKVAQMESYLGLCFPESDIPKQARYLMQLIPYRAVSNVHDRTAAILPTHAGKQADEFDLSWSLLRSASTMHTEYLRNMEVEATFSASLVYKGKLWGLIACHHTEAGMLPYDLWGAMQDLASTLMAKLEQEKAKLDTKMIKQLRGLEESVAELIKTNGNLEQSIVHIMPELKSFLNADGFAFQYGANLYTDGATPPDHFILALLEWATSQTEGSQTYLHHALHQAWPEAKAHQDTACGVLIEPVSLHRICHLIWFRGPVTRTVNWAGSPEKRTRTEADGSTTLLPRNSFASWVETHQDQSQQWRDDEIIAAREILKNMLDIVASQIQLTESNEKLQTFSFAAAHDLKTPLRHIRFVLDAIRDFKTPKDIADMDQLLSMASDSSVRLQELIDGMLKYVSLSNQSIEKQPVKLNTIIESVKKLLVNEIEQAQVVFDYKDLPTLIVNEELVTTLFLNLINNAIQYRDKTRPLIIKLEAKETAGFTEVSLADNGQGIPEQYATRIFEPLKRLHRQDEVSGNGLGLAICQKVMEAHLGKLSLDTHYQEGAKFIMKFKKQTS